MKYAYSNVETLRFPKLLYIRKSTGSFKTLRFTGRRDPVRQKLSHQVSKVVWPSHFRLPIFPLQKPIKPRWWFMIGFWQEVIRSNSLFHVHVTYPNWPNMFFYGGTMQWLFDLLECFFFVFITISNIQLLLKPWTLRSQIITSSHQNLKNQDFSDGKNLPSPKKNGISGNFGVTEN